MGVIAIERHCLFLVAVVAYERQPDLQPRGLWLWSHRGQVGEEVGPVGSATAGRIVSPKLTLVALRQICENRLGEGSAVPLRVRAAVAPVPVVWVLFRLGESASGVRALFPGWARRLAPECGQIPKG